MTNFETLQREVGVWSEQNFGDQPAVNPLLGVVEEFGELIDQIETHEGVTEHELDCVGDVLVYLADFCHRQGFDYQAVANKGLPSAEQYDPLRGGFVALGDLTRSVLKRRQDIRTDERRVGDDAERRALTALLNNLDRFARSRGYTLSECIQVAWEDEVVDREWDSSYTG